MLNLSKYEKHAEVASAPGQCYECGVKWPCDTSLLLAEVRRLREELADTQRQKYGTPCKCEAWIAACGEAEEKLDALRQSRARLLAAAKNADCCCGARECEGLRAAVAEAEAIS